jgi:hypothetical protein
MLIEGYTLAAPRWQRPIGTHTQHKQTKRCNDIQIQLPQQNFQAPACKMTFSINDTLYKMAISKRHGGPTQVSWGSASIAMGFQLMHIFWNFSCSSLERPLCWDPTCCFELLSSEPISSSRWHQIWLPVEPGTRNVAPNVVALRGTVSNDNNLTRMKANKKKIKQQ